MGKIGIIVGAAPLGEEAAEIIDLIDNKETYSIAADGGIIFFIQHKIVPNLWLGDMDSFEEQGIVLPHSFKNLEKSTVSPIKDETDMELGIIKAIENGCEEIYVFGGLGGKRNSHTIANIQMLHRYCLQDKKLILVSENCHMICIHNSKLELPARDNGFVSVFSLSDKSIGVKITGLFYEYGGDLRNEFSLGVSNEFCGKDAIIAVEEGTLLVVCEY